MAKGLVVDSTGKEVSLETPSQADPETAKVVDEAVIKHVEPEKVVHLKKFMDGQMTPQEVHQKLGFRVPCAAPGCTLPPAIRIKSFMQLAEFVRRYPETAMAIAASNKDAPGCIPIVHMTFGKMVKISDIGACGLHKRDAEIAAAKAPSFYLVEIDRGPDPTNKVQVSA